MSKITYNVPLMNTLYSVSNDSSIPLLHVVREIEVIQIELFMSKTFIACFFLHSMLSSFVYKMIS